MFDKNILVMEENTLPVWEIENLENGSRALWHSMGFLDRIGTHKEEGKKVVGILKDNFWQRWRTRPEDQNGIVFDNHWRVSLTHVHGMPIKKGKK